MCTWQICKTTVMLTHLNCAKLTCLLHCSCGTVFLKLYSIPCIFRNFIDGLPKIWVSAFSLGLIVTYKDFLFRE